MVTKEEIEKLLAVPSALAGLLPGTQEDRGQVDLDLVTGVCQFLIEQRDLVIRGGADRDLEAAVQFVRENDEWSRRLNDVISDVEAVLEDIPAEMKSNHLSGYLLRFAHQSRESLWDLLDVTERIAGFARVSEDQMRGWYRDVVGKQHGAKGSRVEHDLDFAAHALSWHFSEATGKPHWTWVTNLMNTVWKTDQQAKPFNSPMLQEKARRYRKRNLPGR